MCVWICVSSRTPDEASRKASTAQLRYSPLGPAQRQALAERRLVDLDDPDAGRFEVDDFVADGQRDLKGKSRGAADRRARTTIAGS